MLVRTLGSAVLVALVLPGAGCHHTATSSDDGGVDGGDLDTDSDADSDTGTDTDSETDTWPVFDSDCHVEEINGLEITWCNVPAGTFRMGCQLGYPSSTACAQHNDFVHDVALSEYEMMDREVSVAMYRACIEAGPCDNIQHYQAWDPDTPDNESDISCRMDRDPTYDYPYGYDDHPMNCIDWYGLQAFCEWIGARLPTEAEWEHAAHGDHDGLNGEYWITPYSPELYADVGNRPCSHSNYWMSDGEPCEHWDTAPVASLKHTSFGLYDMSGNVAEWVSDWWDEDYYDVSEEVDPQGPTDGEYKVVRGGGSYKDWLGWQMGWHVHVVGSRDRLPPWKDQMDELTYPMSSDYGQETIYMMGGRCARSVE